MSSPAVNCPECNNPLQPLIVLNRMSSPMLTCMHYPCSRWARAFTPDQWATVAENGLKVEGEKE